MHRWRAADLPFVCRYSRGPQLIVAPMLKQESSIKDRASYAINRGIGFVFSDTFLTYHPGDPSVAVQYNSVFQDEE
jgi:hypothetical protein